MLLPLLFLALLSTFSCGTDIETTEPFVAELLVSGIPSPRELLLDSSGDILVLSRTISLITAIRETIDGNGNSIVQTTLIVNGTDLVFTHSIAYNYGYLYASSQSTVYRWPYTPGQFSLIDPNSMELVIVNIDTGLHRTRTLLFDGAGNLYVSIGSYTRQDVNSSWARIRKFNVYTQTLPIEFNDSDVYVDGVRNTVGMAFNLNGVMFGVDNQPPPALDAHPEFGDIWVGNPAEELNKFGHPSGTHYGYPYCWSAYNLTGYASGVQFVWPEFDDYDDEYCRDPKKNVPPIVIMPAHAAPLSIQFYKGQNCAIDGGFPCSSVGDAFVTLHGSSTTGTTVGYKVVWYPFDSKELPTGEEIDVAFAPNVSIHNCNACFRPVSAIFNKNGHMIVSADTTNEIFKITYRPDTTSGVRRLAAVNVVFLAASILFGSLT